MQEAALTIPSRLVQVIGLLSGLSCAFAGAFATYAEFNDNPNMNTYVLAGGSIAFAAASQIIAYHWGERVEEETGAQPIGVITTLWLANSLIVVWDILIIRGESKRKKKRSSIALLDFSNGELSVGLTAISPVDGGGVVPNLLGGTF